ncbi:MAG: hypothetical protein ABIS03_14080 [Gemmatimonadaceae bacterium]
MNIFLLWQRRGDADRELAGRVALNLQSLFSPLFSEPPKAMVVQGVAASLVSLELPVRGWKPPFWQEDGQTWAMAVDYPINGRTVLAANGVSFDEDNFLPALGRQLQDGPRTLLKEMAPPFSLVWSSKQTGETFVQNDGLGHSQLFEFEDDHLWAVTNKLFALKTLGVPCEPEPAQWAVWATLGWFPMEMTGYKNIRFLEPATQVRLNAQGISRVRSDVLLDWVHPPAQSREACLELARSSLLQLIRGCIPLCEKPSVGLTAGWDSRAVVSALRAAGARFSTRVRGLPGRHDVAIAAALAKVAGLKLRVQHGGGLPPVDALGCRRSILQALLWQAGHVAAYRHKSFLVNQQHLEARGVSITGQHGEIGRRERALFDDHHAKTIQAAGFSPSQYEDYTLKELMTNMPPFIRRDHHELVRETIRNAYHQADKYELSGLARMDFFSLYEFTRRKGSTVHAWQTRLLIAPFLNPDFIRAVFGYVNRTDTNAFHRYMIAANAPDWVDVPYFEDLEEQKLIREALSSAARPELSVQGVSDWKQPKGRHNYDGGLYWQAIGKPLIEDGLAHGGLWTEVFDPDIARREWKKAPDELAVVLLLPQVLQR